MTIVSDSPGAYNGLTFTQSVVNPNPAYSGASSIENVVMRGDDWTAGLTHYWGNGFLDNNVSNISMINYNYNGGTGQSGTGIHAQGNIGGSGYAVVINIANSKFVNCNTGFYFGDFLQGVTIANSNMTGCLYGANTVSAATAILSQLSVVNSQFDITTCGVCIQDTTFNGLLVTNNIFIVENNAKGIQVGGTQYVISGNNIAGVSTSNTVGVFYPSGYAQGGINIGNNYIGLTNGIVISAGIVTQAYIKGNHFAQNTVDYNIGAGSSSTYIDDTQPRNYADIPTCNSTIIYSRFLVANSNTTTFHAALAGGGGYTMQAICDGTATWRAH
jgi:hypothetical protein